MDVFRLRLNCIDQYQAVPLEYDPPIPVGHADRPAHARPRVPVIRIFGATETGQKVCAHVHGAFPYLYVRYSGDLRTEAVDAYIRQLHLSIDHALAVSYRRNVYDDGNQYVAHITTVKGIPFYGYQVGYQPFLKVYLLNPLHMTRLADLLRQGAIMKRVLQPYESHMQYLAQWMCDFNLYGCAYMECKQVKFRAPVPDLLTMSAGNHRWHNDSIPAQFIAEKDRIPRQSHCAIEIDLCVQDILNRNEVRPRSIHHDFVERHLAERPEEKLVQSMAGLWRDETRRRKARMGISGSNNSPFPPEVLVSVSADPRNSQPGGWIHEDDFRAGIQGLINEEHAKLDPAKLNFDEFVDRLPNEQMLNTTLDSVEDLFPEKLSHLSAVHSVRAEDAQGERPEVDETRALSFREDDIPYESDEELARELELTQKARLLQMERERKKREESSKPSLQDREARNDPDIALDFNPSSNQGPASSDELRKLGIRNAGDHSSPRSDLFDIPLECASDNIRPRSKAMATFLKAPVKRGRASFEEYSVQEVPHIKVGPDAVAEPRTSKRLCKRASFEEKATLRKEELEEQNELSANQADSTELSRPKDSRRLPSGTGKLSFTIVKDPHDPDTIARLSQRSGASSKGSQPHTSDQVSRNSKDVTTNEQAPLASNSAKSTTPSSSAVRQCAAKLRSTFGWPRSSKLLCFGQPPPLAVDVRSDLRKGGAIAKIYQEAYYSSEQDVPERPRDYGGKEFRLESLTVAFLPAFDASGTSLASQGRKLAITIDRGAQAKFYDRRRRHCSLTTWEIAEPPPTKLSICEWLHEEDSTSRARLQRAGGLAKRNTVSTPEISQIRGATQKNKYGFKYSQKVKSTSVKHETQYMSIMSLEVHVNTRGTLLPNPEIDEISCVFWCLQSDNDSSGKAASSDGIQSGVLVLSEDDALGENIARLADVAVDQESTELDLINRMIDIVRNYDPDILTGYEVHGSSWGYMIERARCKYDYNLCDEFSRMMSQSHGRFGKEDDRWGFNHTSTIRVTGRHMINIWRAMRGELNLLQYTMENVAFQLCHKRIPHYRFEDLTRWYTDDSPNDLAKVVHYYLGRVRLDLEILEKNELVPRTSEQARLLGVDFFSVFSRGSQFKVESLMFRIAKPENFLLPSPSRKQVGQQNALECLPLVMEPQSAFYTSPLLVLDFQSLYPSVMIAYNYCYSTFLGRITSWRGQNKMGFTDYHRSPGLLELLRDYINIAPNGMMYARPEIRKSLLAKMLGEILETRVMVKSGMKVDKEDKTLQRLLNNRQLALKLIANVTYGYTSASFSGRMPCSEIADSIVQTARETLEKAIALIHSVGRWDAEVVYGDTDSLFVYLKGRTKDQAFDIGQEIAKAVTDMNPRPIKLKFEKVYLPCVLLAKKRYVGFKYESKDQKVPEFDAKGIETVRRDGTPAEQKIEEQALKILFRTADLSQVKSFFLRQCAKIMRGSVSIQDFCFAREVKLGTYSDKGPPPPGALISTRKMLEDPRAEPQYGERVPYVVITGAPGARLIDRCVAPEVLLANEDHELDAEYYISKNLIPPLERIFNLVGANVRQWYDEMPKFVRARRVESAFNAGEKEVGVSKKTVEAYMRASSCLICRQKLEGTEVICGRCKTNADTSTMNLQSQVREIERVSDDLDRVCRSCAGLAWTDEVKCDSKDCPVFYSRTRHTAASRSRLATLLPSTDLVNALSTQALEW